ncbi:MAG TPA: hypothetical protein P5530_03555 [Candidatus Diapherotrites archaeon]|jgi:hypothetical protein|nr:hypothetical protein [Candidatus Diapherotrites archaeon]
MSKILLSLLNYLWVFIKLLLFSALLSLPFIGLTYLFQKKFNWLRKDKKLSFAKSLFIIIFIITYIVLILIYFIPILDKFSTFTFFEGVLFVLIQLGRLLLVNLLFTSMLFIVAMFISMLYDSFMEKKEKKKKTRKQKSEKLSFIELWKSFAMVLFVILLFLMIIFPSLIAMIIYLIFM